MRKYHTKYAIFNLEEKKLKESYNEYVPNSEGFIMLYDSLTQAGKVLNRGECIVLVSLEIKKIYEEGLTESPYER